MTKWVCIMSNGRREEISLDDNYVADDAAKVAKSRHPGELINKIGVIVKDGFGEPQFIDCAWQLKLS